jgi:hypothetical protein
MQLSLQANNVVTLGKKAIENIDLAKKDLEQGEVQRAWGHFYDAELYSYYLIDEHSLRTKALSILYDCSNSIDASKKKTVQELVGKARPNDGVWELKPDLKREEVIAARGNVQKYYTDKYTVLGMILRQFKILGVITVILLMFMIPLLTLDSSVSFMAPSFQAQNFSASNVLADNTTINAFNAANFTATNVKAVNGISANSLSFLLSVALFGALGGTFSAILALGTNSSGDIPEKLVNSWVTIAKPLIGAVSAVAIFIFLLGGIVQQLNITNYVIFAFAFIAGFSERIVLGAITKDETKKS